jgi:type II secretory pathway pseudopilin PulG
MRSPNRLPSPVTAPVRWATQAATRRRSPAPGKPADRGCPAPGKPARRGLAHSFSRRLASESGFAVPTVMLMTVAALGMAGVAVSTSIQGQGGTVRDQGTKSALAVAESGIDQALLQFNRYGIAEPNPCEPVGSGEPDAAGWCEPVTGIAVNGGTVTYHVKPDPDGGELEVVAEGAFEEVTRRIHVSSSSSSGQDMFVDATVQSQDGISLNANSEIHAGSATNGDITLSSKARQCGVASVGIGKELKGSGYFSDIDCETSGGEAIEDEISLPPVNQGDAPANNDNDRFFGEDPISGNKGDACWDGEDGNGKVDEDCGSIGSRELLVDSNSSVTMGGSVYSFCKLTLKSNSSLYIAAGAEVTIYFDSPENCGYEDGETQLDLQSNSRITSADGEPVKVRMLFVGSSSTSTRINLNSNTSVDGPCEQNFVVYAPYTDIELDSNTKFCGGLAGKTVHLDSNAQVWTSSGIESFVLPNTAPHYVVHRFVDCTATTVTGLPDAGC